MRSSRVAARGFTLVEMVISAMLLGFLAVTATFFWVHNLSLVQTVNTDTATLADARVVLERLSREIREVKYAGTGYCVSTMSASQMVFTKTIGTYASGCGGANPSNVTGDFAVNVQLSNGLLTLGYGGTLSVPNNVTSTLASNVGAFTIRYLDAGLNETASAAALRYVELRLTLAPTGVQSTEARTLVALRNS